MEVEMKRLELLKLGAREAKQTIDLVTALADSEWDQLKKMPKDVAVHLVAKQLLKDAIDEIGE